MNYNSPFVFFAGGVLTSFLVVGLLHSNPVTRLLKILKGNRDKKLVDLPVAGVRLQTEFHRPITEAASLSFAETDSHSLALAGNRK